VLPPLTPLRGLAAIAAAATLVVTAGCTGGDDEPEGPSTPDQVTYLTSFQASAHDAFIYYAEDQGFFDEANIDLTIELGSGSQNYPPMLAGEAEFTYTDLAGLLIDIGQGSLQAGDFRALAAVHHTTLTAIIAPVDAGITAPADLEGKRLAAFEGSPTFDLLPAYAEMSGWEFDPELLIGTTGQELFGTLASGQVDALSTFIIQKGVIESIIQKETIALPFPDYLDDVIGTGLITTSALAEENPDLVERFRDAALQGLRATLENPQEAIEVLQQLHPDAVQNVDAFVAQIGVMTPYITGEGEDRVGVIDEAHVMRCISVLESSGVIPAGVEVTPDAILGELTLLTTSS
jgi:NitT/TauT family transport system substrate-binding protein